MPAGFQAPFGFQANARANYRSGEPTDPNKLDQFTNFPTWFPQQANAAPLQRAQGMLPGLFNTAGLQKSYDRMNTQMLSQASANTAAAAAAFRSRAAQGGGNSAGADFAAASAMQPFYAQQASNNYDLQRLKAAMRGQRAGLEAQIGGAMTDLDQRHLGQMASFGLGQQQLARSADQFELDEARFAEQQRQFDESRRSALGGSVRGGGWGFGGGGLGTIQPGYVPNQGPVQGAVVNGRTLPNNVMTPDAIARLGYTIG